MNYLDAFQKELSLKLQGRDVFLYWKGRVGLYAILKAMGVGKGDEVILPAFTCVVVPNAIIYLGAKPVYVDIKSSTFNMDVNLVESKINERTKAIICQNTFGLSCDIDQIIYIAKKNELYTIEDCTHGFGGTYEDKLNGTSCDAAFFSTQWNKPFSTGIGGFSILNNTALLPSLSKTNEALETPSWTRNLSLKVQLFLRDTILTDKNYWSLLRLYRFLSAKNMITGSSSKEEIENITMPKDYLMGMGTVQAKKGLKTLNSIDDSIELRKRNAKSYTNFLIAEKKNHVTECLFKNHSFLKYPLLVKDRKLFFELAEKTKIRLGDWFLSPIHPIQSNYHQWSFDMDNFPTANKIAKNIINLPTDLDENKTKEVILFLEMHQNLIEDL